MIDASEASHWVTLARDRDEYWFPPGQVGSQRNDGWYRTRIRVSQRGYQFDLICQFNFKLSNNHNH